MKDVDSLSILGARPRLKADGGVEGISGPVDGQLAGDLDTPRGALETSCHFGLDGGSSSSLWEGRKHSARSSERNIVKGG